MQPLARLAADLVVIFHVGYVLYVLVGQILILAGWFAGWDWIRNRWFRGLHLAAITVVVLESWFGIVCPLTTLENWLRLQGGGTAYQGDFIGRFFHDVLFFDWPPWVFTALYTGFGLLVVVSTILVPPRWTNRRAANLA